MNSHWKHKFTALEHKHTALQAEVDELKKVITDIALIIGIGDSSNSEHTITSICNKITACDKKYGFIGIREAPTPPDESTGEAGK